MKRDYTIKECQRAINDVLPEARLRVKVIATLENGGEAFTMIGGSVAEVSARLLQIARQHDKPGANVIGTTSKSLAA